MNRRVYISMRWKGYRDLKSIGHVNIYKILCIEFKWGSILFIKMLSIKVYDIF